MNVVMFTRKVDLKDSRAGVWHEWIKRIAERVDRLDVICLEKGRVELPSNAAVYSIGEDETSRLVKIKNFKIIPNLTNN